MESRHALHLATALTKPLNPLEVHARHPVVPSEATEVGVAPGPLCKAHSLVTACETPFASVSNAPQSP